MSWNTKIFRRTSKRPEIFGRLDVRLNVLKFQEAIFTFPRTFRRKIISKGLKKKKYLKGDLKNVICMKKPHLFRLNTQFLDKIASHGGRGEGPPNPFLSTKNVSWGVGVPPLEAENHCNALFGFYNPSAIHIIIYGGFLSNPAVILLPTRMSRDVAL